jgi:hypothetical protein
VLGKILAGRDMRVEIAKRRFGLLVEFVQDGDVAAERFFVAVEFDANAVDLRGDVAELFGKIAATATPPRKTAG